MDSLNNLVGGLDLKSVSGTFPGKGKNISDYAGPAGMLALLTAMFSSNASGSIRIIVYGMLLEIVRRLSAWLYARLVVQPKVSATFNQGDPVYEWVMLYLTEEGIWKKSKDFDITIKSSRRKNAVAPTEEELGFKASADLVPKWTNPHLFRWNGYWVDVVRGGDTVSTNQWNGTTQTQTLKLSFFTMSPIVISRFIEYVKQRYEETNRPKVSVHLSDSPMGGRNVWGNTKSKIRRPINTVALPPGVMDSILEDVREFLEIEDWYVTAGIPHHRGYLLYGPPGTGKTSTIYALAGELGLEIYALSLAAGHVDDAYLQRLASAVPRGAILLIEDIDCAFPSRDAAPDDDDDDVSAGAYAGASGLQMAMQAASGRRPTAAQMAAAAMSGSRVTMSGILNLMDGVGSDDGRIIFATTNYYDRLDPALVRPGRIDVKVEYMKATADQAASLFQRFFPPERFSSTSSSSSVAAIHSPATTPANKRIRQTPLSRSLDELCSSFASAVPEHEFTAAELQGYLLTCKWDPETAVAGLGAWVEDERRQRTERLEREEREKGKMRGKMTREKKSKGEEGVAKSEEGKTAKVVKAERT